MMRITDGVLFGKSRSLRRHSSYGLTIVVLEFKFDFKCQVGCATRTLTPCNRRSNLPSSIYTVDDYNQWLLTIECYGIRARISLDYETE